MHLRAPTVLFIVLSLLTCSVSAWDYEGHRTVNLLALDSLPPEFPAFVKTASARERIAFLSGEADRWRNVADLPIRHSNAPDHFLDIEDLALADLDPQTVSPFRHVFTAQLTEARLKNPARFPAIDPQKNKDRTRELAGYLPWTITEYYGKLKSSFSYLKAFEEAGTPEEIANAQANVLYLMGVMGHFVGDGAQPLHTTKHFNGWIGDNPHGYTSARTFHSWIDGGFISKTGRLDQAALSLSLQPAKRLSMAFGPDSRDPIFNHAMAYLVTQFAKVEPLYALEKAGKLTPDNADSKEGRSFIEGQLLIAGNMLGSLWLTAWAEAPVDTYLRASLLQRKK